MEELIKKLETMSDDTLTPEQCSRIFRVLLRQDAVLGGKLWTEEDIKWKLKQDYGIEKITEEEVDDIAGEVDTDALEDCTNAEWDAIRDAINKVNDIKIVVTDIKYDITDEEPAEELPTELTFDLQEAEGYYNLEDAINDLICDKTGYDALKFQCDRI